MTAPTTGAYARVQEHAARLQQEAAVRQASGERPRPAPDAAAAWSRLCAAEVELLAGRLTLAAFGALCAREIDALPWPEWVALLRANGGAGELVIRRDGRAWQC